MKSLATLTLALLVPMASQAGQDVLKILNDDYLKTITCVDDLSIKDHMQQMSDIIDELFRDVDGILDENESDKIRNNVMDKARELRFHLHAVFTKKPKKLQLIDPNDVQRAQLVFQKYLADIIIKTIEIEYELTSIPADPIKKRAQRIKVANLLIEIDQTVKGAHAKFRDNLPEQ
ncbi:MAG: hypothetical protein KDD33_10055 [Bdellovibrionales bacterium]|nr:hypothetical protein [Bdellovibrionales bacterium]